ncbi:MAG: DUF5009 domain-containing protein [Clostridia bacterium]|nr:DUF5009 domain-containing protein [Clostridia bacterium]
MSENKLPAKSERLRSIDAARGYAMFWYIGGMALFMGLAKVTNHPTIIYYMNKLMNHAVWHGFTYADTGLPLFLFISGMTFPFSVSKRERTGGSKRDLYIMIIQRCLTLILLGMVYNGILSDFDFAHLRFYSVLGRIGISWSIAAIIYLTCNKLWQRAAWCGGIMIAYWLLLTFVSAPDAAGAGSLTMEGNIAGYVDRMLFPGHIYNEYYDPEGLLGSLSAVSTALMGMMTGWFVTSGYESLEKKQKAKYLFIAAIALMVIGVAWNFIHPINKRLWTSSYTCFSGGFSVLVFAIFYYIIDVRGKYKWSALLTALGMNSIAAYLGYHIVNFAYTSDFLFGGLIGLFPQNWTPFLNSLGAMALLWGVIWFLYKKKIIIKL